MNQRLANAKQCSGCGAYVHNNPASCPLCGVVFEEEPVAETKITALAVAEPAAQRPAVSITPYEPKTFDEAMRLATVFASSRLCGEIDSPEKAMLVMAVGSEMGIPPTTALRSIHIVKGKPVISSDLLVAMCVKRRDICEYFACTESTPESATYETKRVGISQPVRNTFTLDDARRAKLGVGSSDSNWGKYPRAMLRHRCAAELARQVYPDIVLGLYSDAEEEDLRGSVDVTPARVVAEPVVAAPAEESIGDAMARWSAMLDDAKLRADKPTAEKARREIKARLKPGTPEYDRASELYKTTIAAIRAASQPVVDAEVVTEREPGEDG